MKTQKEITAEIDRIIGLNIEVSDNTHMDLVDEITDYILSLFEHSEKLYQFVYNPMIHESASYTVSVHRTRKGAEMAMEFHKAESLKEYMETQKERKESGDDFEYSPFGTFEYWGINEIEIIEEKNW